MAKVISYGAAGTVTGSCHLLEIDNIHILIDCGMFQGEVEEKNYEKFGFNPKRVDFVVLTHAHLDHIGRLPKLFKEGFSGVVIATKATFDLAKILLLDSAKVMSEEYETIYRKALRRGEADRVRKPIYDEKDVRDMFRKMKKRVAKYHRPVKLPKSIELLFQNAGHILGSSFVTIKYKEFKTVRKVVFSGDLGDRSSLVIKPVEYPEKADNLFIESTYGDRNHRPLNESIIEFKEAVVSTLLVDGNVLIPSFAVERSQEILCILKDMYNSGELPECQVFLDSPLAIKATNIYTNYPEELGPKCNYYLKRDGNIFRFPYLQFAQTPNQSRKINSVESRAIIIAGSGMCNGGRILHHMKHRLWNPKNSLIFVGYQVHGTLGRRIIEGTKMIEIYGEKIKVASKVYTINGFSAHADQNELIEWIESFKRLGHIFLIHGEKEKQEIFKKAIEKRLHAKAHIVNEKEVIYL
ncbi:MBL fold metallo-hydrolase RNA specificity domain-containing protein [Nitrosophilus alvini]|uniref:MBL fold metallo-hydrolase RNA specificity domain-containing protein n=1 Tax=Nitrosophilus alvini TaxID=2714855 RepID=UPI00190B780F|nr:MBL fold metallo-hydrolase [Nitrosophilus alvini]